MPQVMLVNKSKRPTKRRSPSKRKTSNRRRSPAKRRASTAKKATRRRSYRRNPAPRLNARSIINRQVMPAAVQAAGALGVDWGYGFLSGYLPPTMTTGMMRHATKGAAAVLLSVLASSTRLVKSDTANKLALGSLTVTMYEAGKDALESAGVTMGYYSPSMVASRRGMGAITRIPSRRTLPGVRSNGMGALVRTTGTGFGVESEAFDTSAV